MKVEVDVEEYGRLLADWIEADSEREALRDQLDDCLDRADRSDMERGFELFVNVAGAPIAAVCGAIAKADDVVTGLIRKVLT